jgi:SNF2 family DNA or RNA helicase
MSSITYSPHPFQRRALERMLRSPSYGLFLSPGAGKTGIVLAGLTELKRAGAMRAALVIAPKRPMEKTWRQEAEKWGFPLTFSLVAGGPERRLKALREPADVYLLNPENVAWLADLSLSQTPAWDVLVVDESQKFKNTQAQRSKALKAMLPQFCRRYCLSGTPAAEGLMDLFGQVRILDSGRRLGRTLTAFRERYCIEMPQWGGYSLWALRDGAENEIYSAISDICYRLDAADYIEMPERRDNDILIESPDALQACERIRRGTFDGLPGQQVAAKLNSMRQATGGAIYLPDGSVQNLHDDKLRALADLVDEHQGEPLMVAVQYRHEIDRILPYLAKHVGVRTEFIAGGLGTKQVNRLIDEWNEGRLPVLVVHPGSVSTGLNLQSGGRAIVWYSLTWSLDEYIQTNARIWRQGQKRGVVIHHLIVKGSIDEVVLEAIRRKDITQEELYRVLEASIEA